MSRYYAGIIAVGMSLFAFLLIAFIETRAALRKKRKSSKVLMLMFRIMSYAFRKLFSEKTFNVLAF